MDRYSPKFGARKADRNFSECLVFYHEASTQNHKTQNNSSSKYCGTEPHRRAKRWPNQKSYFCVLGTGTALAQLEQSGTAAMNHFKIQVNMTRRDLVSHIAVPHRKETTTTYRASPYLSSSRPVFCQSVEAMVGVYVAQTNASLITRQLLINN